MIPTTWARPPGSTGGRVDGIHAGRHRRQSADEMARVIAPLVGDLARASRRILRDDTLADDAIQEALVAYWSRPVRPENPRAWLIHAVTLRSLHLARTYRRRREHERRACLDRSELSLQDDPSRALDHADLLRLVDDSMRRIPEDHRDVFRLWTFEEMDYATIAESLRIPVGTVRSRLNRARKAIRESMSRSLAEVCPSS